MVGGISCHLGFLVLWKVESCISYKEYVLNVNEECLETVSFSPQRANENIFPYKYFIY